MQKLGSLLKTVEFNEWLNLIVVIATIIALIIACIAVKESRESSAHAEKFAASQLRALNEAKDGLGKTVSALRDVDKQMEEQTSILKRTAELADASTKAAIQQQIAFQKQLKTTRTQTDILNANLKLAQSKAAEERGNRKRKAHLSFFAFESIDDPMILRTDVAHDTLHLRAFQDKRPIEIFITMWNDGDADLQQPVISPSSFPRPSIISHHAFTLFRDEGRGEPSTIAQRKRIHVPYILWVQLSPQGVEHFTVTVDASGIQDNTASYRTKHRFEVFIDLPGR